MPHAEGDSTINDLLVSLPPTLGLATRSPLISITLTCSNTTFTLHKALLCHYSAYFSTVCNGRWSESSSGVITLDEVDEEVFNLFVYWLYTQRIPESIQDVLEVARTEELEEGEKKSRDAKLGGSNGVVNKRKGFFVLLKAAVLGDRLLCPGFYAAACNAFVKSNSTNPIWYDQISYAFANLPASSTLLHFIVDMQRLCWTPSHDFAEEVEMRAKLPIDFLVRVMLRLVEIRREEMERDRVDLRRYYVGDRNSPDLEKGLEKAEDERRIEGEGSVEGEKVQRIGKVL